MKEYVLDFAPPSAAQPVDAPEFVPPRARIAWRSIALLVVLESIALALLYVALIGFPGPSQASRETAAVDDSTLAASAPTQAQAEAQPQREVVAPEADATPSRITREHGRYVIELHSTALGPALEMLTKATGATVRGTEVLAGNAARITRTVATDSPLEAWQAVFGGVVNFAATCSRGACAVRFVPSADPAFAAAAPRPLPGAAGEATASNEPEDQASALPSVAAAPPPAAMVARTPPAAVVQADDSPPAEN
jgi:hypothetical protein